MSNAKPAARITDRTQHGGLLVTGSLGVIVEGLPAARLADLHACPEHVGGAVVEVGSVPVSASMPAARKDDLVLCPGGPHQIVSGASRTFFGTNVHIGGPSVPMPGGPTQENPGFDKQAGAGGGSDVTVTTPVEKPDDPAASERSKPAARGGKGRSGEKKPWETPLSPIKERTERVTYGETDLGAIALAYRKKHDYWAGRNLAVFEYNSLDGVLRTVTAISDTGVHSEKAAWKALQAIGVQASQVTRIYSEREPCMLPGAFCAKFINETFPKAEVSYSFEYADKASRVRGNTRMKEVLKTLKGEVK